MGDVIWNPSRELALEAEIRQKGTCTRKICDISKMGHPIHFMFGSGVEFLGVRSHLRGGCMPFSKILNECIGAIGYLIHFHETESNFMGI